MARKRDVINLTNFLRGVVSNADIDDIDQRSLASGSIDGIPTPTGAIRPRPVVSPIRTMSNLEELSFLSFDNGDEYILAYETSGSDRILKLVPKYNDNFADGDILSFTKTPGSPTTPDDVKVQNALRISLGTGLGDANNWMGHIEDEGRFGDTDDAYEGVVLDKSFVATPRANGGVSDRKIILNMGDYTTPVPADGSTTEENPFYPVTSYKLSIVTDDGQEFFDANSFTITNASYWDSNSSQPTYLGHRVLALTLSKELIGRRITTLRLYRAEGVDISETDFATQNYHLLTEIDIRITGDATTTIDFAGKLSNSGAILDFNALSYTHPGGRVLAAMIDGAVSGRHPLMMMNIEALRFAQGGSTSGASSSPAPFNGDGYSPVTQYQPFDYNEQTVNPGYMRKWQELILPGTIKGEVLTFGEETSDNELVTAQCGMERLDDYIHNLSSAVLIPWEQSNFTQAKTDLMQFGQGAVPVAYEGNWWNKASATNENQTWIRFQPGLGSYNYNLNMTGTTYAGSNGVITQAHATIFAGDWVILPFYAPNGQYYLTIKKILETLVTTDDGGQKHLMLRLETMGTEDDVETGFFLPSECPTSGTPYIKVIGATAYKFQGMGNHVLAIIHDVANLSQPGVTRTKGAVRVTGGIDYKTLRGVATLTSTPTPVSQSLRNALIDIGGLGSDYEAADNFHNKVVFKSSFPGVSSNPLTTQLGENNMSADINNNWIDNGDETYTKVVVDDNQILYNGMSLPPARKRPILIGWSQAVSLSGRVFYFRPSTLEDGVLTDVIYYSERNQPDIIPAVNVLTVEDGDSEYIVGGTVYRGRLIIFKNKSFYVARVLDVGTELDWQIEDESDTCGCANKKAHITAKGGIYWIAETGKVYHYTGVQLQPLSLPIDDQLKGINTEGCWVKMYDDRYLLFAFPNQANGEIYPFDTETNSWLPQWDIEMQAFVGEYSIILDSNGLNEFVESHELSVDEYALISDIPTVGIETQKLHANQPGLRKKWRRLKLLVTDEFDLYVSYDGKAYVSKGTIVGDGKTPVRVKLNESAYTMQFKLVSKGVSGEDNGNAREAIFHGATVIYEIKGVK